MVDRPARVVAKLYGQAGRSISRLRLSQPEGPGIFAPGSKAIGSDVPRGMPVANRLCPDENLLRQNAAI
ncbi:hypothetical protein HFO74_12000 [Rhizobium laguerreae]|uniref:Uncharacterized protein n=1 Tax=Rhizobium laguerreae TaxID=1076926 RepID=A0AB35FEB9_9HYPH|nr:hypothetical protein [Rhizobium laguerreae]MBY3064150.1 hypothetical protein [Rhizobium laguerreae]MBY3078019.1 hypothetical protein [Rhizobium laguerreae]MBY3109684.1 hypothetical protein [Rhizobium laguerreae]MBY3240434.1 hypothetical protein [Rhizobium laguerreae]MBY3248983.1 hypothetical protein [Rhizobium laguerreae]